MIQRLSDIQRDILEHGITVLSPDEDLKLSGKVLMYRGEVVNIPDAGADGDVISMDGRNYIYCDSIWTELGPADGASDFIDIPHEPRYEITPKCRSCGAPTDISGHCPYCGTHNRYLIKYR